MPEDRTGVAACAYTIRTHRKARSLKLTVYPDGRVAVTVPTRIPKMLRTVLATEFVRERELWIRKALSQSTGARVIHSPEKIRVYSKQALLLVQERLQHFNTIYGFTYHKITIKNQKTRWGSCTRAGNLNFNYKIALLSSEVADYLVVHELCHRGQMNHSQRFWTLVAKTIPEHAKLRKALRKTAL